MSSPARSGAAPRSPAPNQPQPLGSLPIHVCPTSRPGSHDRLGPGPLDLCIGLPGSSSMAWQEMKVAATPEGNN